MCSHGQWKEISGRQKWLVDLDPKGIVCENLGQRFLCAELESHLAFTQTHALSPAQDKVPECPL